MEKLYGASGADEGEACGVRRANTGRTSRPVFKISFPLLRDVGCGRQVMRRLRLEVLRPRTRFRVFQYSQRTICPFTQIRVQRYRDFFDVPIVDPIKTASSEGIAVIDFEPRGDFKTRNRAIEIELFDAKLFEKEIDHGDLRLGFETDSLCDGHGFDPDLVGPLLNRWTWLGDDTGGSYPRVRRASSDFHPNRRVIFGHQSSMSSSFWIFRPPSFPDRPGFDSVNLYHLLPSFEHSGVHLILTG